MSHRKNIHRLLFYYMWLWPVDGVASFIGFVQWKNPFSISRIYNKRSCPLLCCYLCCGRISHPFARVWLQMYVECLSVWLFKNFKSRLWQSKSFHPFTEWCVRFLWVILVIMNTGHHIFCVFFHWSAISSSLKMLRIVLLSNLCTCYVLVVSEFYLWQWSIRSLLLRLMANKMLFLIISKRLYSGNKIQTV